jgi:hypothetical protein
MGLDTKTYWLTDRQSQCDFDFGELLEKWNWEFRSCKRVVVEEQESREWEYNGVQQRVLEWELSQFSVGDSHGKSVFE